MQIYQEIYSLQLSIKIWFAQNYHQNHTRLTKEKGGVCFHKLILA